jgi:hypothetical protein
MTHIDYNTQFRRDEQNKKALRCGHPGIKEFEQSEGQFRARTLNARRETQLRGRGFEGLR